MDLNMKCNPVRRKDEIVDLLHFIFSQKDKKSQLLMASIARDLIGKYSEPINNHKLYADYISEGAVKKLQGKFSSEEKITPRVFLGWIKELKIIHEHMTPKGAILEVFQKEADPPGVLGKVRIKEVLEMCSHTCFVTKDENSLLLKNSHPDIVNGEISLNFSINRRYSSDCHNSRARNNKCKKDICISPFNCFGLFFRSCGNPPGK